MPAAQLLGDEYLSYNHRWWVAGEHSIGKLNAKEKAAFSVKYLFVNPFGIKSISIWVSNPQIFYATCKF